MGALPIIKQSLTFLLRKIPLTINFLILSACKEVISIQAQKNQTEKTKRFDFLVGNDLLYCDEAGNSYFACAHRQIEPTWQPKNAISFTAFIPIPFFAVCYGQACFHKFVRFQPKATYNAKSSEQSIRQVYHRYGAASVMAQSAARVTYTIRQGSIKTTGSKNATFSRIKTEKNRNVSIFSYYRRKYDVHFNNDLSILFLLRKVNRSSSFLYQQTTSQCFFVYNAIIFSVLPKLFTNLLVTICITILFT